jgi:hypothetical protein
MQFQFGEKIYLVILVFNIYITTIKHTLDCLFLFLIHRFVNVINDFISFDFKIQIKFLFSTFYCMKNGRIL